MTGKLARLELSTTPSRGYSPAFVRALENGGAWSSAACAAVLLAWQEGVALSEDALVLMDVHDLQALTTRLRAHGHRQDAPLSR